MIVTSSSDEKLERARALGADAVVNYKRTEKWSDAVLAATDGRGVDHTIEVGGPGTLPQSIAATRIGGHISLIGVLTGRGGEVPTSLLMARQQRLQGLIVGNRREQQDFVRALETTEHPPGDRPRVPAGGGGGSVPLRDVGGAFREDRAGDLSRIRAA